MAVSVTNSDFQEVGGINPGPGVAYYHAYVGASPDSYDVTLSIGAFDANNIYYAFALGSLDWDIADTIETAAPGTFETGAGNDIIVSFYSGTAIDGGPPTRFFGGTGDDQINPTNPIYGYDPAVAWTVEAYGGSGNDQIQGGAADDLLFGDAYDGFSGNPVQGAFVGVPLGAAEGDDTLSGHDGKDSLEGGGGNDQLFGDDGSDTIDGGAGSDFLFGGPRGAGNLDILTGGGGSDVFLLSYTATGANDGSGFWSEFFATMGQDIAGNVAQTAIADALKAATEAIGAGILAAGLGGAGGALAALFVGFVESLIAADTPQTVDQDVIVVTDFDPREDVLVLPLQASQLVIKGLTESVVGASQVPGGATSDYPVLQFSAGNKVYAYVELSTDFVSAMGAGADQDTTVTDILTNLYEFSSTFDVTGGAVGFTNLVGTTISNALTDGGFTPQAANLPANSDISLFGAIGGLVMAGYGATLAGTNYADALSVNGTLVDPAKASLDVLDGGAGYVHGFGGDDLIFGSRHADTLAGDDGNDVIYSFVTSISTGSGVGDLVPDPESLSGGTGNDTLYGGASAGIFDGGDGTDTFGVIYGSFASPLQLVVDLIGQTAEEFTPTDTVAPAGLLPLFDETGNYYALNSIENAIGGPLNDWIRAAQGSGVEGAAGADYIDATAGDVALSYAGSALGVSVELYAEAARTAGGDAAGDVIDYVSTTDFQALIGSTHDDTLGGYSAQSASGDGTAFVFTGNGGADLFRLLGENGVCIFNITDFSNTGTEADRIDVQALGLTDISEVQLFTGFTWTLNDAGGQTIAVLELPGFTGTLTAADFVFSTSASGVVVAERGGQGLVGSGTADLLQGRAGEDVLLGQGGDDTLVGHGGSDEVDGGAGGDSLRGGRGADHLAGGDGADSLRGGADADILGGGAGSDSLAGRAGDDSLDGGAGADVLRGGAGADRFLLRFGELAGDRILDFDRSEGDMLSVLGNHALTVADLGDSRFLISDGLLSETLQVRGALASDFLL